MYNYTNIMRKLTLLFLLGFLNLNITFASVEMDTVTGTLINDQPKIDWATISEVNSNYFVIERSFDSLNWEEAGTVSAAGNSGSYLTYDFLDSGFSPSGNVVFYRICEIEFNGSKNCYLPIIEFDLTQLSVDSLDNTLSLSVYPNPVTHDGVINLKIQGSEGDLQFEIVDLSGAVVEFGSLDSKKDGLSIQVKLNSGMFLLRLFKQGELLKQEKLVVE